MNKINHIRFHNGFTLIELMITLVLAAMVLSIGIPSFRQTIEQNQLTSQINSFTTALHLARSESVKRGRRVSVCASSDGSNCNGIGYEQGWIVFAEESSFGTREAAEELINVVDALATGLTLRGSANLGAAITYTPDGQSSAAGQFALCKNNDVNKSRRINILITGRVRIDTISTSCAP